MSISRLSGLLGTGLERPRDAVGVAIDRVLGVETSAPISMASLGPWVAGYCDYEPSGWSIVSSAISARGITAADVFLDLGCGKGRVVLAAARLPFSRVEGIEHQPEIHAAALDNLSRYRGPIRCGAIEVRCADAATSPVPDDATHIYLFNPFLDTVADRALGQIRLSQQRRPRTIRLICLHLDGERLGKAFPQARAIRPRLRRPGLAVYELLPQ